MCALGAISRKAKELQDFYQRKVGQGKNKMSFLMVMYNSFIRSSLVAK